MIGDNDKGQTRSEWWLSKIYPLVLGGGGSAFYGTVTTATSTTQFKVDSLKGLGTNLLNDAYYCQVIEADAAAPEGEIQKVSAYTTADGDITVGAAFTVAPAVGDYVLILHESVIAAIADATDNLFMKDVVGNKTDAAAIPSTTTSIVAMLKKVYNEVIAITLPTKTTKLAITAEIAAGTNFLVSGSGTGYTHTGDVGNLLTSELLFNAAEYIAVLLNGVYMIKGTQATWQSQSSFTLDSIVDSGDEIIIIS